MGNGTEIMTQDADVHIIKHGMCYEQNIPREGLHLARGVLRPQSLRKTTVAFELFGNASLVILNTLGIGWLCPYCVLHRPINFYLFYLDI